MPTRHLSILFVKRIDQLVSHRRREGVSQLGDAGQIEYVRDLPRGAVGFRPPRVWGVSRLRLEHLSGQPPADDRIERGAPKRLAQIVIHPRRHTSLAVAGHRKSGHRDDRYVAAVLAPADLARGLKSVYLRHQAVHEDRVVIVTRGHVDRLVTVVGDGRLQS